jgi:uncharacterized protein (TIGR02118 family)
MLVRFGIVGRNPEISAETFRTYWREVHGPLAAAIPGVRRYHQNLVVDDRQLRVEIGRGPWQPDGFSEIWFDDDAAMRRALADSAYAANAADIPEFIGEFSLLVCTPEIVVPPPANAGALHKRISLLTRLPGISAGEFRDQWLGRHAEIVRNVPAVAGYTQNLVIHRGPDPAVNLPYDGLPIDGIVEIWFRSTEELREALHSPAGEALSAHSRSLLAEVTTFEVEVFPVVEA